MLDLNTRYPLTNDWLLNPRLRLGYEVDNATGLKQYTVLPSFLVDYQLTRDLNFEFEVGAEWTRSVQPGIRTADTELLVTIGLRYSFYADNSASANAADDKRKPATPAAAAVCRYSARPDSNCVSRTLASP